MFTYLKRFGLFFMVNILVVVTISVVLSLLGVKPYLTAQGLNIESLIIFCLMWGMGGSFISLMISKQMAKWSMGVEIIDPNTQDPSLRHLVGTVHRLSRSAGITTMPEVGIYNSPDINAFATGPSKNNSLVAVSTGLLSRMDHAEVEGVLAHEVAHISNGDMVTMTLIQGVMNAFVMFFARIAAWALAQNSKEENRYMIQHMSVFLFEIAFGILGAMVTASFSRWREFRADHGGASLAGRNKMIAALEKLQKVYDPQSPEQDQSSALATLKISGRTSGLLAMFSTHPRLEDRIAKLKQASTLGY